MDDHRSTLHSLPRGYYSNFQVSNPSEVSFDPRQVPPAITVVDEKRKRWRPISDVRSIVGAGGRGRKRRSASPPQYTASTGFYYPEEYDDEEIETRRRVIARPPRILRNPHLYPKLHSQPQSHSHYTNRPREQQHYALNNPDRQGRPPVMFADIRPLTIRRRTPAQFARTVRAYYPAASECCSPHMSSSRHAHPHPVSPRYHSFTGSVHTQTHRPLRAAPEWMRRDSASHSRSRGGGRSYSQSSTITGARRPGCPGEPYPRRVSYSSRQRRPQIRLAVHGLSYIDEDAESTILGPAERLNEPRILVGTGPEDHARPQSPTYQSWSYPEAQPESHPRFTDESGHNRKTVISQQPQRHPGMRPGGGNRNAKHMPVSADGTRDWSTDLCLFCDHNLGTCEFYA